MINKTSRNKLRQKRHFRIRHKVKGTASRPRLNVFRSSKHIHAQLIDDMTQNTLVSVNTVELKLENGGNVKAAELVGTELANRAKAANIEEVVFDRGGYLYHGRIKALADAAREAGLEF